MTRSNYWGGQRTKTARAQWAPAVAQGYPCGFCGRPILPGEKWDVDHIIPRSQGGTTGPTRPAHATCNRRAGQRLAINNKREAKPTLPPETQEGIRGL